MSRANLGTSKYDILETFAQLVAELGYDEVSLRMIAEDLGLSKGTIVHHYGTKARMLEAVHHEYMERRLREAELILEETQDPVNQLTGLIAQLLLTQRDDRAATVAFAREISRFSSLEVMQDVRRMRNEYSDLMLRVIQRGIEERAFRPDNAELISLQIFGMCNWTWTWLRPEGRWSVGEILRTWVATVLTGLEVRPDRSGSPDPDRILKRVEEIIAGSASGSDRVVSKSSASG